MNLINRKLNDGLPLALYIESVKEGEEPVNFGPNSVLKCYGDGWKLQTVTETQGICCVCSHHVAEFIRYLVVDHFKYIIVNSYIVTRYAVV